MTDLSTEPKLFRASISRGLAASTEPRIEREGGMFSAGLIRGVSVISRGEALGHDLWIDHDFLSDVTGAINAAESGVKARFTHPGMSSDGTGRKLGKLTAAKTVGDQVFADLHFQAAAHKTPDGDLAEYVMDLAEETPEDFGLSIVFEWDADAMNSHLDEHTVTVAGRDIFTSPDEMNKDNYPHARLAKLRAGDVVDEPAANPTGLFAANDIPAQAEAVLDYVFGLSENKPDAFCGIDPVRLSGFVTRYFARHKLEVHAVSTATETAPDSPTVDESQVRKNLQAEGERYVSAFGEDGSKWFFAGVSFEEAQGRQIEKLEKKLLSSEEQVKALQAKLDSLSTGEETPAEADNGKTDKPEKKTFASRIRIAGSHN